MSTRSRIAVKLDDKNIKSIYCHWDGYPSNNGRLLYKHYNSKVLALKLIMLGDLSILDKSPECPEGHSYDNKVDGFTVAYGRDRNEADTNAIDSENINALIKASDECYAEYVYLFDCAKNKWYYLVTSPAMAILRSTKMPKTIRWYALNMKNTARKRTR